MPSMPLEVIRRVRRFSGQEWALNAAIALQGPEWDQPRLRLMAAVCGHDSGADFTALRHAITKYNDITREMMKAARRRELRARWMLEQGHEMTARESFFTAAALYGMAQWPIYASTDLQLELNAKKNHCYGEFVKLAGRRIERVELPFGGQTVPAYLHFPPGHDGSPVPCVVFTNGMDAYKEISAAMDGDRWLSRGFAMLALDGPGTGESLCREIPYDPDTYGQLGPVAFDYLDQRPDIDSARIVLSGLSMGSLWATTLAAAEPRYAAVAVAMTCLEPGEFSIFQTASPTFKLRFMYMTQTTTEDEVDKVMSRMDPVGYAPQIRMPVCIVAGEDDELSELSSTFRFLDAVPESKTLMLYEGELHALHASMASRLGPEPLTMVADWLLDRVRGKPSESTYIEVDGTGMVHTWPWGKHRTYEYGITENLKRRVFAEP
jgi:dienelactone hydrolase